MTGKMRKPRSDSKMFKLPKEVLERVNEMLLNENMKYSDIQEWLETEHGIRISLSSISKYAVKTYTAAQRMADDLERTKFYLEYLGDKKNVDTGKLGISIVKSGLLQKISSAENEFNDIPIEKAAKLLTEISRVETTEKRLELEYEKRILLALDGFEQELMKEIRNYPELSGRFKQLMIDLKNKMNANEN